MPCDRPAVFPAKSRNRRPGRGLVPSERTKSSRQIWETGLAARTILNNGTRATNETTTGREPNHSGLSARLRHGHIAHGSALLGKMSIDALDYFSNAGGL